jgi:hypothetical protein
MQVFNRRKPWVVCAAVKLQSGLIVCSARHFDEVMRAQIRAAGENHTGAEQGFIDQYGTFMSREAALEAARENGQRVRRCGGDNKQLFSENLY